MKLYTEEQVRESFRNGFIYAISSEVNENKFIAQLTPIELPSDEEIQQVALYNTKNINEQVSFINGATYICNKIQGETYLKCTCSNSLEYSNCSKKCERIIEEQGGNK